MVVMELRSFGNVLVSLCLVSTLGVVGCGSSGTDATGTSEPGPTDPGPTDPGPTDPGPTDPGPTDPDPTDPAPPAECEGVEYESTFDAVQQVVFEGYGCTNSGCHGNGATSGGLDLSAGNSWASLHDVPSAINGEPRILPGSAARSVLYQKVAAATLGDDVAGSPMPVGLSPLTENDLNLVRWWIYGGAPEDGVVIDAEPYVSGCTPDPVPLEIKPLPHPGEGKGIQLEMPTFTLPAGLEVERCFATYFDVCDEVPPELAGETGDSFPFSARELRMDPGSHHLILWLSFVGSDQLDDPAYGGWTCAGGASAGETCEPLDTESCGEGHCVSQYRDGFACNGYGPSTGGASGGRIPIGGAQRAQDFAPYPEGVYARIPCRGVLNWNPHAFNLTTEDSTIHARLNYYFAEEDTQDYFVQGGLTGPIFIARNPPFTKETYCATETFPRGTRLFQLSSHTHQRGERFWITHPDGTLLYENFVYNDPTPADFEPPLEFDSDDPAERTVEFCATYNNGVNDDGSPNADLVTRASRVPQSARVPGSFGTCTPVACVNDGMIGEACNGEDDDAACDSSPGAGDGECDACNITGGESTENEMFLMIPSYYIVPLDE